MVGEIDRIPYVAREVTTDDDMALVWSIRQEVFVQEQGISADEDRDGSDEGAAFLLLFDGDRAVATGRLVPEGPDAGVLGRIGVVADHRDRGLGRLVVRGLEEMAERRGLTELTLHPHDYLESFYAGLGYELVPGTSRIGDHVLITMRRDLRG